MGSVNGVETPENDKLTAAKPFMNSIKMFVNFLEENNIHLCERDVDRIGSLREPEYYRTLRSVDDLLYKHFDLDKNKIEDERQAILDTMG